MKNTYPLAEIKSLIRARQYRMSTQAILDARKYFDLDEERILTTVLTLSMRDFYKTMPSELIPDTWQDVYHKAIFCRNRVSIAYIKLQIRKSRAFVISFKEK